MQRAWNPLSAWSPLTGELSSPDKKRKNKLVMIDKWIAKRCGPLKTEATHFVVVVSSVQSLCSSWEWLNKLRLTTEKAIFYLDPKKCHNVGINYQRKCFNQSAYHLAVVFNDLGCRSSIYLRVSSFANKFQQ